MQQSIFNALAGLGAGSEWSSGVVAVSDPCELPVSIGIRQNFLRKSFGVHDGPTHENNCNII